MSAPSLQDDPHRRIRVAALALMGWSLFGVLSALQATLRDAGARLTLGGMVHILCFYWAWAAVTPLVFRVARAYPLRREASAKQLPRHALFALVVIALQMTLYGALQLATGLWSVMNVRRDLPVSLVHHLAGNLLTYAALILGYTLATVTRENQDRRLQTARLESQLARAQLDMLTRQLQPHFLFNALNSISTLVLRGDANAATSALARLAILLRSAISTSAPDDVPLSQELHLVDQYLGIEQLRFGGRLRVTSRIDESVREAAVPGFIIQPLVENAVRHAVANRSGGGRISIDAARDGGRLRLRIADDGPGFAEPVRVSGTGVGLAGLRHRLRGLYGDDASVTTENLPSGGAEVRIWLPFRLAAKTATQPRVDGQRPVGIA